LPEMQKNYRLFGKPVFPRGEISGGEIRFPDQF
jgi:hypothetical protein